jgi:hypothetical protein
MAEKLSDEEQQNIDTVETEVAHIIPFLLAVFTEREVLALLSYTNFLPTLFNSVTLEPLLGLLYSEPSLASVAFQLLTSMILATC